MKRERGNTAIAFPYLKVEPKPQELKKIKPRVIRGFTAGEKLLYLFSVVLCAALASWIIAKSAHVTELEVSVQKLEKQIQEVKEANLQLESATKKLSSAERIRKFAEKSGFVFIPTVRP